MMKKMLSLAVGLLTLTGTLTGALSLPVMAEPQQKLPFDLSAPENVTMAYLDGNDSYNTIEIHYTQNNSMSAWSKRKADDYETVMQELRDMGYDDLWVTTQIDWSIDSQEDWHANDYWLTEGYDNDYHQHLGDWAYISQSYSHATTMSEWVFREMGNIDDPEDTTWYGVHNADDNIDGWKDVLKEDQYEVIKKDGESHAKIDLTQHTIYTRVRWLVTIRPISEEATANIAVPSDWSEVAAVGKDAEKAEPLKSGDVAAPVISDLQYTDKTFNTYPVIAFQLTVDETLAKQLSQVSGTQGGITLEVEARVQGTNEWVGLQGDWIITAGQMEIALQNLAEHEQKVEKDTPIELRARYYCTQAEQEAFYSDYSEVLTFGSQEMEVKPDSTVESSSQSSETSPAESSITPTVPSTTEKQDKCSLCGFCPHPLGLCIFIWLLILLVIVAVVIVIVVLVRKKNAHQDADKKE